ncbi:GntR family transcriptional regulator/MocR family aminotransferase [Neobacillus bataviensis]|uniref:GntR family transcriptional regulator/MocR family aminotransferase n=1 Tax=Neobacillus bataviensis TaxID=220685 RepID=A0A561CYR6_9BACI|nr:PLP-dependent aminotransferase family protein [Neobacillus bataviensis]TWD96373.1 GntR family transcriptional regulator/MocR family aminotransferase [Neobacillus bataviensis]
MIEITLFLEKKSGEPLYLQLYQYLKREIQSGKIKNGVMLPSKRKLAQHLGVSQNTVETAYQQLLAEGYVESMPRKGIFVKEIQQDLIITPNKVSTISKKVHKQESDSYLVDFSHGRIALEHFPYTTWRRLTIQSLYEEQSSFFLNGERLGEYPLREEIAKYLYQSRGVRCVPEQIIVGAGTQYLIGLLTIIIGRDAIFSMEEPGYHRTREAFKDQGVSLIPVPLDDDGISMKHLTNSHAQITYVTPSHQFPIGMVMPITRRMELLKWAEGNGRYIIEDDYDGEFRYKGKPIPSLQGLDPNDKVIYLGTFSKSLIPSIRINYMVLPQTLLQKYNDHFSLYKQTVSRLHQHTLWQFMKEGHWERHLNKMRTVYRKRQHTLISSIKRNFGGQATIIGDDSGLHILLRVQNAMSEKQLIESAKEFKVKVYPTSVYFQQAMSDKSPMILLGFGGLTESEIEEGIQLLKKAWNLG